ncbi:MAG: tyrosine--tRNA ligase [Candidatus Schekmanbacteria bacterium]|nr:tyrosine--tRNA ligase [Candidatus Schekmanbacteria bacterium]
MLSIDDQIAVFRRGATAILPDEEALRKKLIQGRTLRLKLGVDPTKPDLHLGHTVQLRKARQLQDLGHHLDFIIGNFTAMVGDPTGQSATRPALGAADVDACARTYVEQAFRILDPARTTVWYNADWLAPLTMREVIDLASRVTVARILERDDFLKRFQASQPIHLHELLYPLLQAYDSVHLRSDVELGGTDQTFNLLTARTVQERFGGEAQVVLTMPLLRGTDGDKKMSKSLGNAVGITDAPLEMYSRVLSIPDDVMREWFELVTEAPLADIEGLFAALAAGSRHPKDVKKLLARSIVAMYAGPDESEPAEREWEKIHEVRAFHAPEDTQPFAPPAVGEAPAAALRLLDLAAAAGFTAKSGEPLSRSELRRLIEQGGVAVDGEAVRDFSAQIALRDGLVLSKGNKVFRRLRLP